MHATELVEIASWAAFSCNHLLAGPTVVLHEDCHQYWFQSKCRQNRWMTALKMFERDIANSNQSHDPWPAIEIVAQEIFLSELLTRIWSAAMVALDRCHGKFELTGLAHSIHIGHLEAKNRAMRLLLDSPDADPDVFDRLNSLRRKIERWTDLLLGQIADAYAAELFAFHKNRVLDFRHDVSIASDSDNSTQRFLFTDSLADDIRAVATRYSANPESNRRIAEGVLACFPADRFDSLGMPNSVQLLWLEKAGNDAFSLLNRLDLLESDSKFSPADDISHR